MKLVILLIMLSLAVNSCSNCRCPVPGPWSECDKNDVRSRTEYDCRNDCEPIVEFMNCPHKIEFYGKTGMRVEVSPSKGEWVKDTINVQILDPPKGTSHVTVLIFEGFLPFKGIVTPEINERTIKLEDSNGIDGWSVLFNTKRIVDGEYTIFVGANNSEINEWLGTAYSRIVVSNPAEE